jgi:hypothetical protein
MPGPYIHIAVADQVMQHLSKQADWPTLGTTLGGGLPKLSGPSPADLAALARKHPNYYALGAVGPDVFFFLPDFRGSIGGFPVGNSLIGVVEFIDKVYDVLDNVVIKRWEEYFGPFGENVEEALSRLTGGMSTVVQDIMGSLVSAGTNLLMTLATQSQDWFGYFSMYSNIGYDNQDFVWSDMLHYRKTSRFGLSLWRLADETESKADPNDPQAVKSAKELADKLHAYAIGYITHLGADITCHPFVNEKSGGPFRLHWQRHHLVENHMDAKAYDDDHGPQINYNMLTESALHFRISFNDDGSDGPTPPTYPPGDNTLRGLYVRRNNIDLDSKMPVELAQFIYDAMDRTYATKAQEGIHDFRRDTPDVIQGKDGRPEPLDIQTAYGLLFKYMKLAMLDGFNHEKPKPPDVFPNLDFPLLTNPHDEPPGEGDDDMDFLDWILAILRFILWLAAVALWLVTILPTLALDVATYLPRLAAYYGIQLPLYYILKAQRSIMVMSAFLLPMQDEIDMGSYRLCSGRRDIFHALLHGMDDDLGGLDNAQLAQVQAKVNELVKTTNLTPDEALVRILGDLGLASVTSGEKLPDPNYPHQHPGDPTKHFDLGPEAEYHHPWQYPTTDVEERSTFAGPFVCDDVPHTLLEDKVQGNQKLRSRYEQATTPEEADGISRLQVTATNNLGDPINFSSYLLWQLTRSEDLNDPDKLTRITDWNLDADRGYAYKCWDWNRQAPPKPGEPLDEAHHVLRDADGHPYLKPCTPPPQSGTYQKDKPLELHYLDQPDPGCHED